jgi:iron(III) transport system substrate-binding protein
MLAVLFGLVPLVPAAAAEVPAVSADLVKGAEAEGKVVVYSPVATSFLDGVVADFQKAYPNVKMEYLRAQSPSLTAKLLSEHAAGHNAADVFLSWWDTVTQVATAGALEKYVPDQAVAYDPSLRDPDGKWSIVGYNPIVAGYNTDVVSAADAPVTWADVLDPKWAGKVSLIDPRIRGGAYVFYYHLEKLLGDGLYSRLSVLKPFIQSENPAVVSSVASGQMSVGAGGYQVWLALLQKAPIKLVIPPEGVPMMDLAAGTVSNSPHPQAAHLFVSWLLSDAGQRSLANNPAAIYGTLVDAPPPAGLPPLSQIKRIPTDYKDFLASGDKVTTATTQALGLPPAQ